MLSGNKKAQRVTAYVIIGAVVLSLALSLLTSAGAHGLALPRLQHRAVPAASAASDTTPSPSPTPGSVGSTGNPKPVTKTPQGQATQVTDTEHLGGLLGFIAFMLGGVLLLVRSHRRNKREERSESILT